MNHTVNLKKHPESDDFDGGGEQEQESPVVERRTAKWKRFAKRKYAAIGAAIIIAAAALFGFAAANSSWRAVFLSNNQVYFGKFWDMPFMRTMTLRDVYYLQINQPLQPPNDQTTQFKVVKLGSEFHAPKGEMRIPLSQIIFWEDLRNDSPVVRAIMQTGK